MENMAISLSPWVSICIMYMGRMYGIVGYMCSYSHCVVKKTNLLVALKSLSRRSKARAFWIEKEREKEVYVVVAVHH